ncbi:hypothetical protein RchiOBHm_Chr4g0432021 [Rosa chinensis]|uniref:Uncharacterized protein n=1 Tax=Rosa chinensis TaxID=74649 RepID=A0A2P6R0X8_ROSCH|nr:hypothetical protein RchiOBHm_Chr4g0432021 [Rosa chinensis]
MRRCLEELIYGHLGSLPMGWSKGFMDNDGNWKKRRKFTQSPNRSTNLTEKYYTNKVETAKWVDGRIRLHYTLIEGILLVKSEVACVKYDIRKLCSMLRCLEPNMETMRKKICEIEQSLSDMKVGAMESIVADVIKVLKTTSSYSVPQVGEKVLESKEDIDGHNSWTDITKEKEPRKLCPCTPIATDGLLQMKISDKAPHEKVDHMADEKVTESADKKTLTGFNDSKVKNKNNRFPSMRNLSKKDSKILKFLFDNGDNGVDDPRFSYLCTKKGQIRDMDTGVCWYYMCVIDMQRSWIVIQLMERQCQGYKLHVWR